MNVGFLCEGQTEQKIVDSQKFKLFVKSLTINHVGTVNTKGNGKLLPKFLPQYNKQMERMGAWRIFILTDSDKKTIKQIYDIIKPDEKLHILIISVKKVESWFLSNEEALKAITGITYAEYRKYKKKLSENVEELGNPYKQLEDIFTKKTDLLDISKLGIAQEMIDNNFDIQKSNCESAKYFVEKLEEVAKIKPSTKTTKPKRKTTKTK